MLSVPEFQGASLAYMLLHIVLCILRRSFSIYLDFSVLDLSKASYRSSK